MRPLTLKEMLLVSGGDQTDNLGTVTVTPDYDWDYDPWAGWDDPADDYYNYPENGGGGGGGSSNVEAEQIAELGKAFLEIAEETKIGTGVSGTIFSYLDYSSLSQATAQLTVQWALNDIEMYRQVQMHVPNPQGSLIPWQTVQVEWGQYDQGGTAEDVLRNYFGSL
jgi:hypothetical protein